MDFKSILTTSQEVKQEQPKEWKTMDEVYATWKYNCEKEDEVVKESGAFLKTKYDIVTDALSSMFPDFQNYWQQFGFLNSSSIEKVSKTVAKHITVQEHDDDMGGMYTDRNADEDDE